MENTTINNNNNNNKYNNIDSNNDKCESKDEVDFVIVSARNNNNIIHKSSSNNNNNKTNKFIDSITPNGKSCINDINKNNTNNNNMNNGNNTTTTIIAATGATSINNTVPKSIKQNPVPNKEITTTTTTTTLSSSKKKKTDDSGEKKATTKERLSLFSFTSNKKISQKQSNTTKSDNKNTASAAAAATTAAATAAKSTTNNNEKPKVEAITIGVPRTHKFVKSASIARLLGNTYNAKKFEKSEQKLLANDGKFNTYAGRRRLSGPYLERFRQCSKEDGDVLDVTTSSDLRDLCGGSRSDLDGLEYPQAMDRNADFSTKAMRTISRGLGKLWWRKSHSVDISTPDPEFKVSYLGNVLTGWAKGEGCVEKQLNTLWRNYTQNTKPDVIMRIKVCASGLKATTRQHGLTEYWSNRITHCCAPKNYPRVFCWIYRHEGRKLKHELRCHAVLCSKEKIVQDICNTLKENLECALRDFKREKILKQNARLSLANAAYENPSLPRRKILLSVGGNNYRPPLERSKSAPKLMSIEEAIGEEEGEEVEETNEPEMKPCCQKDSLYPAMTLGRRRCRRGHSIRRTGKARPAYCTHVSDSAVVSVSSKDEDIAPSAHTKDTEVVQQSEAEEQRHSYGSDDSDDFDKLLKYNNYDATSSLANELLPYFDMQLHKKSSCSLGSLSELKDEEEPLSLTPTINCNPSADPHADFHLDVNEDAALVGLRRNGVCSDGEEEDYLEEEDEMYFRQASILNMLHRRSMRKMANLSMSSDESSIETNASLPLQYTHQTQSSISSNASSTATSASSAEAVQDGTNAANLQRKHSHTHIDSDEGSISSGCETASTVTANQDDISLRYRQSKQLLLKHTIETSELMLEHALPEEDHPITVEEIYQRLESRLHGRHNSDATTFSSSSSITLKLNSSPTSSMKGSECGTMNNRTRKMRRQTAAQCEQRERERDDSDSECSDESGYVEFQERDSVTKSNIVNQAGTKPIPPPKPTPRRLIGTGTSTAV